MDDNIQVHAGQRLIVHDVQELSSQNEVLTAPQADAVVSESLLMLDRNHHYVSVDDGFARLLGVHQEEMIGRPVGLYIGLNTYDELIRPFVDRAFAGEVTALLLLTTHETMGTLRMAIMCYPCFAADHQIGFVVLRMRDVSAGVHLRQAALRRKQRHSALHSLDMALSGEARLEKIGALAVHSLLEQTMSQAVTLWQLRTSNNVAQDSVQEALQAATGRAGMELDEAGQTIRQIVASATGNSGLLPGERLVVPLHQQKVMLGELVIEQSAGKLIRGELRDFVDEVVKRLEQALFREHLLLEFQKYTVSLERIAAQRTQEVARRRHTAVGLHEILGLLIANRPLPAILDHIVRQAETMLGADAVAILEAQENGAEISCTRLQSDDPFSSITAGDLAQVQPTIVKATKQRRAIIGASEVWTGDREGRFHSHLAAPMVVAGALVGVVVFFFLAQRTLTTEEVETASVLSDEILFAVESDRLQKRAREGAALKERERLANELHDAVTQSVYSLTLFAKAGQRHAASGNLARVQEDLQQLGVTAQQAMKQMRLLLYELRPNVLEQTGLLAALQQRLEAVEQGAGLDATLEIAGPLRLPSHIEDCLYRIAQEALNNVLRHSSASQVLVRIQVDGDIVTLEITDDGAGFEVTPEVNEHGIGMNQMRARAAALNADLTIESTSGQGTCVRVAVLVPGIGATMRTETTPSTGDESVGDESADDENGIMTTG